VYPTLVLLCVQSKNFMHMHVRVSEPTCQYAQSIWSLKFTVLEALCMSFISASVCNDNAHTTIYPSVYPTLVLLFVQSKNFMHMHVRVSEPTCQYAQSIWSLKFTVLEV
jgi:hypothetical protein